MFEFYSVSFFLKLYLLHYDWYCYHCYRQIHCFHHHSGLFHCLQFSSPQAIIATAAEVSRNSREHRIIFLRNVFVLLLVPLLCIADGRDALRLHEAARGISCVNLCIDTIVCKLARSNAERVALSVHESGTVLQLCRFMIVKLLPSLLAPTVRYSLACTCP